jgi:hypothetical protein
MPHLGICDADAPIFGYHFAQRRRSALGQLHILRFDLLGCLQIHLCYWVRLALRLRLELVLYRYERRQHD